MKLTILGSGSYQPEYQRHSSSHLIQIGKQNLVFDFGRGVMDQLQKSGVEYYQIDKIFISHTHSDHCSELAPFLHIALAEPKVGKFRRKDITIYGPMGFKKTYNHILMAFDLEKFRPKYKILVKELKPGDIVREKTWTVKAFEGKHSSRLKCYCYRITSKNKSLAYSGDSEDCPDLRRACQKANLALLEASWPHHFIKEGGHMSAEVASRVAQESKVKKLVLTHASPYYLRNYDLIKLAKRYYKGPVIIAKDLMEIKI